MVVIQAQTRRARLLGHGPDGAFQQCPSLARCVRRTPKPTWVYLYKQIRSPRNSDPPGPAPFSSVSSPGTVLQCRPLLRLPEVLSLPLPGRGGNPEAQGPSVCPDTYAGQAHGTEAGTGACAAALPPPALAHALPPVAWCLPFFPRRFPNLQARASVLWGPRDGAPPRAPPRGVSQKPLLGT